MTIKDTLIKLRDDFRLWCINNFNRKLNKNLGAEKGSKFLVTDENGEITVADTPAYSAAGSNLGLVKSGGDVTISSGIITVNDDSHNHTIANIDNLQTTLSGKQSTIIGGASTITNSNLTSSRALVSNGSGKVAVSTVTSTELEYLDGVTSNVQTQFDTITSDIININNNIKMYMHVMHIHCNNDAMQVCFSLFDNNSKSYSTYSTIREGLNAAYLHLCDKFPAPAPLEGPVSKYYPIHHVIDTASFCGMVFKRNLSDTEGEYVDVYLIPDDNGSNLNFGWNQSHVTYFSDTVIQIL